MLAILREQVDSLLKNSNTKKEKQQKYLSIKHLLQNDDCFFKIPIEVAFSILKDLNYSDEESLIIYKKLIDSKNYKPDSFN